MCMLCVALEDGSGRLENRDGAANFIEFFMRAYEVKVLTEEVNDRLRVGGRGYTVLCKCCDKVHKMEFVLRREERINRGPVDIVLPLIEYKCTGCRGRQDTSGKITHNPMAN